MAVKWTEEQRRVIDTRNCDVLVSAAAGSGKTAVLVARILAMITDPDRPVDIDRLLVVTFTNAAAAEMRERIRDALEQRAEEEPENIHLQRQLVLIHNARITTIHSFCLQVLRGHFHTLGIDPSFRVADEGEMLMLKQDALRETLEAFYQEGSPEFHTFLEKFATGKNDIPVEEMVLSTYQFSLGQPWPEEWLASCRAIYDPEDSAQESGGWAPGQTPAWLDFALEDAKRVLEDVLGQLRLAVRIAREPDGPYPYLKALGDDIRMVETLCQASTYRELAEAFASTGAYTRLGAKKDSGISEEKKLRVQELRSGVKEDLAAVRGQYFYDRPEILRQEFLESGVVVRVLTRLVEDFTRRLTQKKTEKNLLDFSDLEHLALRVLIRKEEGRAVPTSAAREYGELFEEIMIDEYQDSNMVQELILGSVSGRGRGERNLFMVGDVKQSIYRFRLARPELFMEKYKAYQNQEGACRIDLHRNFRSRPLVLSGVNYIFRQIMAPDLGGILYDRDAALYPGASFAPRPESAAAPGGEPREASEDLFTELHLLEASGQQRREEEARLVGARIQELVGHMMVWDKEEGGYRPAAYRDVVILLRTVSGWSEVFGQVLSDMGIPCFTGSQKGYFSATEVQTVLSYLQVLDNPVQDIPLAAVLRGAIGGLTDEELAGIRGGSRERRFYDCCQSYRREGENPEIRKKLDRFFDRLEQFRRRAMYTPVHLLLWQILEETGYGDYAASLPGGAQRKANLDMLVEKAIAYESTSYRGLYHFVRYIGSLKKYEVDYGEANVGGESEDTVRIMSIHKSKGLEFPIVFVSGMGKQFNESDLRARAVLHPELGIGCDYVDETRRLRRPTLLKKVIQRAAASENLGEELRVLYVAMTRAKEKLILTGSVTDVKGRLEKWSAAARQEGERLPYSRRSSAATYLDWAVPALLRHPDAEKLMREQELEWTPGPIIWQKDAGGGQDMGEAERSAFSARFTLRAVTPDAALLRELGAAAGETMELQELLSLDPDSVPDEEAVRYLEQVFGSVYPYEDQRAIPGKLSVSELKRLSHMVEEEDAQELYRQETVVPLIPGFMGASEEIRGAARGTVYHSVMENFDFSKKEELEIQLEEWISCGKMSREEAGVVREKDILHFLETEMGKRMAAAAGRGRLFREKPFVLGVPADQIRGQWSHEETVLVQGIIDAWFIEEDGGIVLLDYKTDRVATMETLVEKYRAQLEYYAMALSRLTGRRVKEKVIYSFHLGQAISL